MSSKRVALVYLTPEGVNTWVAGVGSVINGNMQALPRVVARLREELDVDLSVYFATPAASPEVRGWNPGQLEKAEKIAADTGGRVFLLPNHTDGSDNFGDLHSWQTISGAAAGICLDLARNYDRTVVLAHSSHPFALAPVYIDMQASVLGVNICTIYVLHSTAIQDRTFQFKGRKYPDQERVMVEALAIQWAKFTDTIRLGCISEFMGRYLVASHGADPACVVPVRNAIDPTEAQFALLPEKRKRQLLQENGIPLHKPLLFSWGRFVPEKGFDFLLELAKRLDGALHPVIIGMVDHSPEYPDLIRKMAGDLGVECTIVVKRDAELVAAALQWPNTRLAALVSTYDEPFGLVVNEARVHARAGGPVVMASNRGGLPEQVTPGQDGLVANVDNLDATVATVKDFLKWPESKHAEVRAAAVRTYETRYDWANNLVETLSKTIPLE